MIEADGDVCEGSRATCISRRSLQVLERLGAEAAFVETRPAARKALEDAAAARDIPGTSRAKP